nr:hypothetical protein [Thioalkalivibrio sp.]
MAPGQRGGGLREALNDMLWLLPAPFLLILADRFGSALSDRAFVAAVLGTAVLMAAGIWLRAVVHRRIFLAGALRGESPWYRWLRGGAGLALVSLLASVPLAAILLVAVIRPTESHLLVGLVVNVPVLVLLRQFWMRRLAAHAVPRFQPVLALRFALALNFMLLFLVLAIAAVFQSYPDFGALTLTEAMLSEAGRQQAASGLLQSLMQLAAAKDALSWWLGQQMLPGAMQPGLQFAAWAVLLATNALVVWSYLLVCSSVLTLLHWRNWHPGTGRS